MLNSHDQVLNSWANKVKYLGLSAPAAFFLEAYKPLSFVTGQFVIVGQPLLNLFFAPRITSNVVCLLTERANLEAFIALLEQD
ncbi:MAG: hypothetical protein AAF629_02205 [Chloroflexota bacterium]